MLFGVLLTNCCSNSWFLILSFSLNLVEDSSTRMGKRLSQRINQLRKRVVQLSVGRPKIGKDKKRRDNASIMEKVEL